MEQIDRAGSELSPVAAFAIVPDPEEGSAGVAVWVSNRLTRTTTVQRVQIRAGQRRSRRRAAGRRDGRPGAGQPAGPVAARRDLARAGGGGAVHRRELLVVAGARRRRGACVWRSASGCSPTSTRSPRRGRPRWRCPTGASTASRCASAWRGWARASTCRRRDGTGARLQRALLSVGVVRLFRADQQPAADDLGGGRRASPGRAGDRRSGGA